MVLMKFPEVFERLTFCGRRANYGVWKPQLPSASFPPWTDIKASKRQPFSNGFSKIMLRKGETYNPPAKKTLLR